MEAVVLRRQALRDTQELLVLFTPEGRVDCVSRVSVKRTGLLEPLTCIQASLRSARVSGLPSLQEVSLERTYPGLLADYDRLHWAGYLLNLWLEAFPGQVENTDPYRLLRLALDSLEAGLEWRRLVTWTELQAFRLLGSAPQVRVCLRCSSRDVGWFASGLGGVLCGHCRGPGSQRVGPELLDWLGFLQRARLTQLAAAEPAEEVVVRGRGLMREMVLGSFPRLEKFL